MRIALKSMVVVPACALAVVMGIYFLDGFEFLKVLIWSLCCIGLGHVIYALLRIIDKKYKRPK